MVLALALMTCFIFNVLVSDAFQFGYRRARSTSLRMCLQVKDLKTLSVKQALNAVCDTQFEDRYLFKVCV
jgi:hypothetical protein